VRALVTGGAGFVGSTLVDRLLAEGHAVDVIDDLSSGTLGNLREARAERTAELHIHQVDLRSPEAADLIARRQPEVVFHLAASHAEGAATGALTDVVGSLHVLEGARAGGARKVVVASGAAIYGDPEPETLPVRESATQEPIVPGGAAARALLEYLRLYRDRHGIEFTSLALSTVYGPRAARGAVANFARALLGGATPELVGDGSQTRDFLYVDDAVDAFVRAADRGSGLLVNVSSGVETSVRTLLVTMAGAAGVVDVTATSRERDATDVDRIVLDPGRAKLHLGWSPWTSLEEGIALTLEFWSR
jgi:UDP-glucose 4-epimerase